MSHNKTPACGRGLALRQGSAGSDPSRVVRIGPVAATHKSSSRTGPGPQLRPITLGSACISGLGIAEVGNVRVGRSEVGLARDDVALASASNGLRNVRIGSRRALHSGRCNPAGIGWCFWRRPKRNAQALRQRGKQRSCHPMHNPVPLGKAPFGVGHQRRGTTLRLEARRRPLRGVPKQLRREFVIQDGGSGMRGTYPTRPATQQS